jgi:hypothetical protein
MVPILIPEVNVVTSADQGMANCRPVIFLNTVTPGNYCFIQELGIASGYFAAAVTVTPPTYPAVGAGTNGSFATAGTPSLGNLMRTVAAGGTGLIALNLPVFQG